MNTKEKIKEKQNDLLIRIYDLILDKQTPEDERAKLIEFKNAVESGKDFETQVMNLAENLRLLALYKFKNNEKLSPKVGKLYLDIHSVGLFEKNLATGLSATLPSFGSLFK